MLNQNILKGKWKEIKGEVRRAWGNLTDDEVEATAGDATKLAGLVQTKYGITQEEARSRVNDIVARFNNMTDSNRPADNVVEDADHIH